MLSSTILILTGLVITGGSTMTTSMAPTVAELTPGVIATTASPTSKHFNTLEAGQTTESVTMMGFTNQTTTFVETSAESNITSSRTSSVHSTSTAIRISSKSNVADSLTTTPSSIVTETQTLKTENTKAMKTSGKITTPTAHTTKRIPSTFKVFVSSEQPSTTKKTFTIKQHKTTVGQHKKESEALSSGSVAAIVVGFITIVIILLGGAYYFKMRRSSYGRLLDDTDHSSFGNFFNPMFDG
ncbi:prostate androgen-regulated mucin-like protein 1 homolog [Triplophysa rosa]|uniref:Prostate androgen-regulated mucin-like protein 1 n=1 Tax=Triplophysa rosa TaxID=992332 RepID=A0A9W7T3B2_TRIRA|nr:prostate androgen-regulated mucin-like protein 1 homolog [Triplophysa rosa]KAI7789749.1 putative prostate androgen-regulated mucin-like protein 1 [Triplophysa rosa]